MKILQTFMLLFWPILSFGQLDNIIKESLSLKEIKGFNKLVDSLKTESIKSSFYVGWEVERELVPNFQERILNIQSLQFGKDSIDRSVFIKVNLISTDNMIAFYELRRSKVNNPSLNCDSTIDKYQNDSLLKSLEKLFFNSFGGQLNRKDLFIDSIIYGNQLNHGCYNTVSTQKTISTFVSNKDVNNLLAWLHSSNVETQLYAVEGFYKLKLDGFKLSDKQSSNY